jgi:hypothetical protein
MECLQRRANARRSSSEAVSNVSEQFYKQQGTEQNQKLRVKELARSFVGRAKQAKPDKGITTDFENKITIETKKPIKSEGKRWLRDNAMQRTIIPRVLYSTRYVRARPSIAFVLSSGVHLRPCTLITRLCMRAMGSEFEFMNIEAAIAKLLQKNGLLALVIVKTGDKVSSGEHE